MTVCAFPNWKKDATAAERLDELAGIAREHPERFGRFVVCYQEELKTGGLKFRTLEYGCDIASAVGLFELGKQTYVDALE